MEAQTAWCIFRHGLNDLKHASTVDSEGEQAAACLSATMYLDQEKCVEKEKEDLHDCEVLAAINLLRDDLGRNEGAGRYGAKKLFWSPSPPAL